MSDHAWTHEHVAAYLAGGLDAAERERFDAHVAGCPGCAAELAAARAADRAVDALFAPVRPGPALEDRLIRSLRVGGVRRSPWPRKLAWGVAATVGLGAVGAGVSATARDGGLRFPGGVAMAWEPPTFG